MTTLRFDGVVAQGDSYRCGDPDQDERYHGTFSPPGAILIGDRDVVAEIHAAFGEDGPTGEGRSTNYNEPPHVHPALSVALADERWSGPMAVELGWGYSEWTPVDPDSLTVGDHDLVEILARHEGQTVTLWVADEPIDLLGS